MNKLLVLISCLLWLSGCGRPGTDGGKTAAAKNVKQELLGNWKNPGGLAFEFQKDRIKVLLPTKGLAIEVAATYKWTDDSHILITYKQGNTVKTDLTSVRFESSKLYLKGAKESKEMELMRVKKK